MTDRGNAGGGGMTGATGDLTPDDTSESFTPGERREVEGKSRADVTLGAGGPAGPERSGSVGSDDLEEEQERF